MVEKIKTKPLAVFLTCFIMIGVVGAVYFPEARDIRTFTLEVVEFDGSLQDFVIEFDYTKLKNATAFYANLNEEEMSLKTTDATVLNDKERIALIEYIYNNPILYRDKGFIMTGVYFRDRNFEYLLQFDGTNCCVCPVIVSIPCDEGIYKTGDVLVAYGTWNMEDVFPILVVEEYEVII